MKGAGFAGKEGRKKPTRRVPEQCEMQTEKSDEKRRWVPRGLDYTPLDSTARERVDLDAIRGAQCMPAGPRRGRKEVAEHRSLECHPCLRTVPTPAARR